MFFALDLIESYGSGIRRAKNAMKDNNSPKLVFEPDNDLDDYTMVTAYINEEFARIRDKEDEIQTNRKENHKENHKEKIKLDEIESRIIDRIRIKSNITIKELAIDLKISEQSVRYRLDKLKNQNIIYRIGSTKSGEWVINDYMIEDIDFDN